MHTFLVILFMVVIGAIIGGVTNVIAIRMLFHPYKPYYIFKLRIPFTPGLIPKRREEIATKIGQVIEEHLITEELVRNKLNEPQTKDTIYQIVQTQFNRLKSDQLTIRNILNTLNLDPNKVKNNHIKPLLESKIQEFYINNQNSSLSVIMPNELTQILDDKVEDLSDLLFDRARTYLSSDKGSKDIESMLETFFIEKGKIVGLLQMFMTKESIAERIQTELIRLTRHPQAKSILNQVISNEYESLKNKPLNEILKKDQLKEASQAISNWISTSIPEDKPIAQLAPEVVTYIENNALNTITQLIINKLSQEVTTIMKKINLKQLVEDQINTFDLKYIENIILDIAKKELNLIMSLGFILGGIIGFFQGIIAIFV